MSLRISLSGHNASYETHCTRRREQAPIRSSRATGTVGRRSWTSNTPFSGMTQAGSTGMFSASTSRAPRWTRQICETRYGLSRSAPPVRRWQHRGLRDGMRRWTNGLPGATARLGAKMALRGLSVSQCRMRADTHPGPEHQCSTQRSDTLMQLSRSTAQYSALRRTAGPYILARRLSFVAARQTGSFQVYFCGDQPRPRTLN